MCFFFRTALRRIAQTTESVRIGTRESRQPPVGSPRPVVRRPGHEQVAAAALRSREIGAARTVHERQGGGGVDVACSGDSDGPRCMLKLTVS